MLRLPSSLERRLAELFPRVREREQWVTDVLTDALDNANPGSEPSTAPENVGGTLHLFSDGGSRGNPGQAAIGYIIEDPTRGVVLRQHGECLGIETNNVAEYRALIEGLKAAQRYRPNRLICHLDSELIVKQLSGEYQVKMATLQPLFDEVRELSLTFPDIIFRHIPRSDNYRADALVNKALNEQERGARKAVPNSQLSPSYKPPQRFYGGRY
ncbi:MAG: ribonuclease HI family protein [Candidatus Peribacteraceae bacterium]|nr:ribonuclease HI family protein [Candidatus Peribacteraceae bacterium]